MLLADEIYELYERASDAPRSHLGASELGHPCDLWLWLKFRGVVKEHFDGRMLRLFDTGKREESRIVGELQGIGYTVSYALDEQAYIDLGWMIGGSPDGVASKGDSRFLIEIKTHSQKNFDNLTDAGSIKRANRRHYLQMQLYMHGLGIEQAIYVAVNKNTDEIYTEHIEYAERTAKTTLKRGHRITRSMEIPQYPQGRSVCAWCAGKDFCWGTWGNPPRTCRTCSHGGQTGKSSGWICLRSDEPAKTACKHWELLPDLEPRRYKK